MELWLDRETFSEYDLKEVGTYRYADHAEDLLISYAIGDGPAQVWDCTAEPIHDALYMAMQEADIVWAHNAQFDKAIHKGPAQRALPPIALDRWQCSMALALSHALPASLAELCEALEIPDDQAKLAEGKKLINLFCKPQPANRKVQRATRLTHPAEWARFKVYAAQDIEAMRACVRRMPRWNWDASAIAEWHCDQRINERGFYADRELTQAGIRAAVTEKTRIGTRFRELTGGVVDRPSQRAQFCAYLNEQFCVNLDNTRGETFQQELKDPSMDARCAELMRLSIASNKTSTAKYAALDPAIQADQRFRGGLQFAGAGRTRRWAGRMFQAQNLPSRGLPAAEAVELYIDMLKVNSHDLYFDDLMRYGAAALRGIVTPAPDNKLVVADLANIEGRMLAWVAREQWKLAAFREYDAGTGPDLYNITAVSIIGGDPWNVPKKDRNVFGKVPDLACLAADTRVLTQRGLVPIVSVLTTDFLWDGESWVNHEGLQDHGVRPVVNVDGITATPDHLINTQGTWLQAWELATNADTLNRALATGSVSYASLGLSEVPGAASARCSCSALAGVQCLTLLNPTCVAEKQPAATGAPSKKALTPENTFGDMQTCAPTRHTADGCSTGWPLLLTAAETQTTKRTPTTAGAASGCTPNGCKTENSSSDTCCPYLDGTTPSSNWTGRTQTGATCRGTCGSSPSEKTATTSEQSQDSKQKLPTSQPVYDLLNAGPRHRFLVKSDSGWLLVHNSGYQGGVAGYQTFAHAYGIKMADHWDTIQKQIAPGHVAKAWDNLNSWGRKSQQSLEISDIEWVASETCKLAWRARHRATVQFWYDLQTAAKNAINEWGSVQSAGPYIKVRCVNHQDQRWMLVKLPNGRYITYFEPRLIDGAITYMGESAEEGKTTRQWIRVWTHGGKMTGNCLAKDTIILTSTGAKPIVQVQPNDLVWDGESWVPTAGVINQGIKEVGTWLGLRITGNHLIHDGNLWKPAMQLDECSSANALLSALSSVLSPSFTAVSGTAEMQRAVAYAAAPTTYQCGNYGGVKVCNVPCARASKCPKLGVGITTSSPTMHCETLGLIGTNTWCAGAQSQQTPHTGTTEVEASKSAASGLQIAESFSDTQPPCPAGQSGVLTSIGSATREATNPEISGLWSDWSTATTPAAPVSFNTQVEACPFLNSGAHTALNGQVGTPCATTLTKGAQPNGLWKSIPQPEAVFDLVNCGPNSRFTVLTKFGPVLVHNCCQTLARDVLMPGLQLAEERGYLPVLSVHDEIICEVPDTPAFNAQGLIDIMARELPWSKGLPLAAAGFECYRYRKD